MPEIEVKPEHAADPNSRRVGILVGVVGIFLSVVTIASHRAHTKAVIYRTEANDDWSYYQAKKIRENTSDVASTVLEGLAADPAKVAESVRKLQAARQKYADDAQELQAEAKSSVAKTENEESRALRFDIGEGLLELGLVLCSLFFLARNVLFPLFGTLAAVAGIALGIWGWLL
jgi:cytochrome c556